MNKVLIGIVALAMVATAVPMALAYGFDPTSEPNFSAKVHGVSGDIMNKRSDFTTGDHVYFDAFIVSCPTWLACPSQPNQNFENPTGRLNSPGFAMTTYAYLGLWRDCNKDGFIGDGADGLSVYPATGGSVLAACPLGSGYAYQEKATGVILITEFRWIGAQFDPQAPFCGQAAITQAQTSDCGYNDVNDSAARVWGDWALPTQHAVQSQGVIPLPPGTLDDTYSMEQYADDASIGQLASAYNGVAGSGAWAARPDAFQCDQYSNHARRGGCGNNGPLPDGDSPTLIVRNKFNDSESGTQSSAAGHPIVTIWNGEDYSGSGDCTALGGLMPMPNPAVDPAFQQDPLHQGGLDETEALAFEPMGAITGSGAHGPDPTGVVAPAGPGCDPAFKADPLPAVVIFPELELGQQSVTATHNKIDHEYNYVQDVGAPALPTGDSAGMPVDVTGSGASRLAAGFNGAGWFGGASWSERPPRALWGKVDAIYTTHYARVGAATIAAGGQLPAMPAGAGVYGADGSCPSFGSGISALAWDCNIADWNAQLGGNDPTTVYWQTLPGGTQSFLGQHYDLRDVDCYDDYVTTVGGTPVYAGIAGTGQGNPTLGDQGQPGPCVIA
ncbi:MAG: hypothetical protein ACYDCK_13930 [Thermoplasmatota archaeon]